MSRIRVAIAGVGNCSSSLVQGVEYYREADPASTVPGLMHVQFGDYHINDVEFVAAFDVDAKKVGQDLADAVNASENNTIKLTDVPRTGVTVQRGPTLDGLGKYYRETITESDADAVDVVAALKQARADVLVCYLPVGSEEATKHYAQAAIDAGVAFVNALPVFIASTAEWAEKFEAAGVPIVGDDIKSQVGATITHRVRATVRGARGAPLTAPTSSTSAGTWTSRTCSNGTAGIEEDLQNPRRSPPTSSRNSPTRTSTSARATTCNGSMTASGRTCGWKGARSVTCRSIWNTSSRCGTLRTPPGSSSTPFAPRRSLSTAVLASDPLRQRLLHEIPAEAA